MVKTSPYGDRMVGNMLYSCVAEKKRGHEQFVAEHSLGFILAGEVHFETPVGMYIGKTGTMGLARKNQLIKSWKVPGEDGTFKAINITFDQDILRRHSAEKNITATGKYTGAPFVPFEQNPFLKGFFDSLAPYFDAPGRLTESMVQIKTNEAIELLLQSNPQLADLLFDFSEPYKIDLESFME